jgi:CheY-like chemotaxis protein
LNWEDGVPANQITILVAEDEAPLRDLLVKILHPAGYQLLIASDGKQALEIAEQHTGPIDLLLSDIGMPELSGVALARAITAKHPATKIILTSTYLRDIFVMDRSWQFIAKPYVPAQILDSVREALHEAEGHAAKEVA